MKKLNRDRLIMDLKLLAAGANGGNVTLDDDMFPNLQTSMSPSIFTKFALAVHDIWFTTDTGVTIGPSFMFGIENMEKWENFNTLADEIIAERKRIDSCEKMKASEQ